MCRGYTEQCWCKLSRTCVEQLSFMREFSMLDNSSWHEIMKWTGYTILTWWSSPVCGMVARLVNWTYWLIGPTNWLIDSERPPDGKPDAIYNIPAVKGCGTEIPSRSDMQPVQVCHWLFELRHLYRQWHRYRQVQAWLIALIRLLDGEYGVCVLRLVIT